MVTIGSLLILLPPPLRLRVSRTLSLAVRLTPFANDDH
jgi:hypothetical protein